MTMLNAKTMFLAGALAALAACAGGSDAPTTPESTATPTAAAVAGDGANDGYGTCVATFERQRTCTDQFVPALVDMRVRMDQPPGIAAKAQAAGGRDALIAEAKTEWADDSKDENIAQACTQITTKTPPEKLEQALPQIKSCLAENACDGFVGCLVPIMENMHGSH